MSLVTLYCNRLWVIKYVYLTRLKLLTNYKVYTPIANIRSSIRWIQSDLRVTQWVTDPELYNNNLKAFVIFFFSLFFLFLARLYFTTRWLKKHHHYWVRIVQIIDRMRTIIVKRQLPSSLQTLHHPATQIHQHCPVRKMKH